ncbi:MAG: MFS transporter [Bacteroidetes bacterium]|nr:MFS transporter [Bacteroidota bacterium]MBM3424247.1 MFS transporter [Bacteroidota bacterium]
MQSNSSDHRPFPMAKRLLILLTVINLFNFLDRYVLSAVLEPIKEDLGIQSDADMGRLATAFMLGYFLTSPIFGYLGDKLSRRKLMAVGIIGWSLGTCLTGLAQGFSFMIFCRIMVGLGEASFGAIAPAVISDAYPSNRRNKAITFFSMAVPIGAACGFALGGILAAQLGWRSAFFITGLPGFLLAALLFFIPEPERGMNDVGEKKEKISLKSIWALSKNKEYLLVNFGYVFYTFAMGAFSFWGPSFLHRVHGMKEADAALFLGPCLVFGGIVGTLIGGYFANLWRQSNPAGYAKLLVVSMLFAVPFSFISFLTQNTLLSMICIGISLIFLFQSTGPINTVILESVPSSMRASAMAICIFMIHAFGDLWSPELVGRVSDSVGNLRIGMLILPGAFLLAALCWFLLYREQKFKVLEQSRSSSEKDR